jgi:hypothetical protein
MPMSEEISAATTDAGKKRHSLKFKFGVLFLVINIPFGYGAGALAVAMEIRTGHPALAAVSGAAIYALSWVMLGLGIVMAGPEGVKLVRDLRGRWFGRKEKSPSPDRLSH